MKPTNIPLKQGCILLAEPSLNDFYFKKSVILLAEHNESGSFGFILNKPVDLRVNDLLKDYPKIDARLYLGGPVNPDRIFAIHLFGDVIEESIPIKNGLYWGGDIEKLMKVIADNKEADENFRFFIGYAGWRPNQLENELKERSWLVLDLPKNSILKQNPFTLWRDLLNKMGNEYAIWANYPSNPIWN